MRKLLMIGLLLLTFSVVAYAQQGRNSDNSYEGKTNFSSIGVQGLDTTGNPGYIEMRSTGLDGDVDGTYFYLWVDSSGKLRITSRASVTTAAVSASFPNLDWDTLGQPTWSVIVGTQTD